MPAKPVIAIRDAELNNELETLASQQPVAFTKTKLAQEILRRFVAMNPNQQRGLLYPEVSQAVA